MKGVVRGAGRVAVDEDGQPSRVRRHGEHERGLPRNGRLPDIRPVLTVELQRARRQVRVPPARAVPDDAELPVRARQRTEVLDRARDIAHQSLVGHAAGRPRRRGGVVGRGTRGLA